MWVDPATGSDLTEPAIEHDLHFYSPTCLRHGDQPRRGAELGARAFGVKARRVREPHPRRGIALPVGGAGRDLLGNRDADQDVRRAIRGAGGLCPEASFLRMSGNCCGYSERNLARLSLLVGRSHDASGWGKGLVAG
jgi:hypothetical protein